MPEYIVFSICLIILSVTGMLKSPCRAVGLSMFELLYMLLCALALSVFDITLSVELKVNAGAAVMIFLPALLVEETRENQGGAVAALVLFSSVIALVENLQRRDLDFFEEANGFKRLIEQFGLTQEEAARKVGKTQSAVANKLRLLRLSQQNMELIRCNNLTERHARALLRLNDEADRINVTNYIIEHELNVSRTEEYIDEFLKAKENPQPVVEPESGKHVVRLFKDVRFFLNTLNRAVGVMVDAGIGATVKQQESDDGLTLTICIPHAKG